MPCGVRVAAAQQRLAREVEAVFAEPGRTRLGRLFEGAALEVGPARDAFTQVTVSGWIFRESVNGTTREGHSHVTNRDENVRAEPNGRVVARFIRGTLLDSLPERRGGWVRVRRAVWLASAALAESSVAAPAAAVAESLAAAPAPDPRRGVSRRRLNLFRAPDSAAIGSVEAGLPVRITARAGPWVRVEVQGWVRESEVRLSDANILSNVSAAELRGAPEEFRGRLLRWTIQFLSLQTADELRPDFTPGQRYILARGPAPEYAFVYVVVPPGKLADVQRLTPLASVTIVARVINGRSTYLANPILELVELQ